MGHSGEGQEGGEGQGRSRRKEGGMEEQTGGGRKGQGRDKRSSVGDTKHSIATYIRSAGSLY